MKYYQSIPNFLIWQSDSPAVFTELQPNLQPEKMPNSSARDNALPIGEANPWQVKCLATFTTKLWPKIFGPRQSEQSRHGEICAWSGKAKARPTKWLAALAEFWLYPRPETLYFRPAKGEKIRPAGPLTLTFLLAGRTICSGVLTDRPDHLHCWELIPCAPAGPLQCVHCSGRNSGRAVANGTMFIVFIHRPERLQCKLPGRSV